MEMEHIFPPRARFFFDVMQDWGNSHEPVIRKQSADDALQLADGVLQLAEITLQAAEGTPQLTANTLQAAEETPQLADNSLQPAEKDLPLAEITLQPADYGLHVANRWLRTTFPPRDRQISSNS